MSGRVYLLGADQSLQPMEEEPYEAEALLQALLAEHPDLLAGEQLRPAAPRRWLLVSRELPVPADEGGGSRWSLDHLFIDQDGVPTLVEVKRSSNSQIRREVVGQMLDYAANGSAYWSLDQITSAFEKRCEADDLDPDAVLDEFIGSEAGGANFWQTVKTNLQAGRIRMLFVADEIPGELRRIIEFLNEQMDPAEVAGVEVRQFVGEGRTVLGPRAMGVTAEAQQRKAAAETRSWDLSSFLDRLREQRPEEEVEAAQRILDWVATHGLRLKWGRGVKNGSFSPKADIGGVTYNMFSLWTYGGIAIQFSSMDQAPFDTVDVRREFADRLQQAHERIDLPDEKLGKWPIVQLRWVVEGDSLDQFLEAWEWYLSEAARSGTDRLGRG